MTMIMRYGGIPPKQTQSLPSKDMTRESQEAVLDAIKDDVLERAAGLADYLAKVGLTADKIGDAIRTLKKAGPVKDKK